MPKQASYMNLSRAHLHAFRLLPKTLMLALATSQLAGAMPQKELVTRVFSDMGNPLFNTPITHITGGVVTSQYSDAEGYGPTLNVPSLGQTLVVLGRSSSQYGDTIGQLFNVDHGASDVDIMEHYLLVAEARSVSISTVLGPIQDTQGGAFWKIRHPQGSNYSFSAKVGGLMSPTAQQGYLAYNGVSGAWEFDAAVLVRSGSNVVLPPSGLDLLVYTEHLTNASAYAGHIYISTAPPVTNDGLSITQSPQDADGYTRLHLTGHIYRGDNLIAVGHTAPSSPFTHFISSPFDSTFSFQSSVSPPSAPTPEQCVPSPDGFTCADYGSLEGCIPSSTPELKPGQRFGPGSDTEGTATVFKDRLGGANVFVCGTCDDEHGGKRVCRRYGGGASLSWTGSGPVGSANFKVNADISHTECDQINAGAGRCTSKFICRYKVNFKFVIEENLALSTTEDPNPEPDWQWVETKYATCSVLGGTSLVSCEMEGCDDE